MLNHIKQNYKNLYIVIIAISISLWFEGVNRLIRSCIPKTLSIRETGAILCMIALSVFYFDDGNLSELYNYRTKTEAVGQHAPAIVAAANYDG